MDNILDIYNSIFLFIYIYNCNKRKLQKLNRLVYYNA